jgi:hypothetical protein
MKFWKLLGTVGCLCVVLIFLTAYLNRDAGGDIDSSDPTAPRRAPSIPIPN